MKYTLKTLKSRINEILTRLAWHAEANNGTLLFSNLNSVRYTINELENLALFDQATNELHKTFIYSTANDIASINNNEGQLVKTLLTNLRSAIENLSQALDVVVPCEDSTSINIKLPPVNDFEDLSVVSRDLHIALTQVLYIDEVGGRVK